MTAPHTKTFVKASISLTTTNPTRSPLCQNSVSPGKRRQYIRIPIVKFLPSLPFNSTSVILAQIYWPRRFIEPVHSLFLSETCPGPLRGAWRVVCGGYLWGFDTARGFPGRPAGPQDKKTKGNLCGGWPPPTPRSSRGDRGGLPTGNLAAGVAPQQCGAVGSGKRFRQSRARGSRGSRFRGSQSSVWIPAGRPVPRNHSLQLALLARLAPSGASRE